ncbi:MAG: cell division protein FtsZ [archaeon]|nr:cell division protein FtsZ [archaeon]
MKTVVDKAIASAMNKTNTNFNQQQQNAVQNPSHPSHKKKKVKGAGHDDAELTRVLEQSKAKIRVIGVGGGGNNTINRMTEIGIIGAETIAVNTDAQDLLGAHADKKILIGRELTRGLGSGSNPSVGEASARESLNDLKDMLEDSDLIFITCGMGGGTGTGAAPIVAEIAKEMKALTVGVVTLPFTVEGRKRMENALDGLARLKKESDTVIVIPNDKILEIAPDLPVNAAFKVADEVLTNAVKGITEMVTKPGLINLDFADLRTILEKGGAAMIGLGESRSEKATESRALEAVENALTSPLLDVDISEAGRALVNVIGGSDMTLREAEMIVEAVSAKIHANAHIIWGAMIDDTVARNHIQAMVVISGGKFPYLGAMKQQQQDFDRDGPIDLGIDFAD